MPAQPSPRFPSDPERGGVNAPLRSPGLTDAAGAVPYSGSHTWQIHPHDPASLVRDGRPFLPLGVYARTILTRRDADVGRLMLSLAAHRANCIAWDLLPESFAAVPNAPAAQWPWPLDHSGGGLLFERFHSAYFARLEVLLHALSESNVAILLRTPTPDRARALQIPHDAWRALLAEVADRAAAYPQAAFAVDCDGYLPTVAELRSHLPDAETAAFLESPTAGDGAGAIDSACVDALDDLRPRPRLLWLHADSLLRPLPAAPRWSGPVMHSFQRPSDHAVLVPTPGGPDKPGGPGGNAAAQALGPAANPLRLSFDPAYLAAAWNSFLQGAGLLWSYASVGIFQAPLRDLAPMQGFARIIEELRIDWTGLSAARHLFGSDLVLQPVAAQARGGAILAFYPAVPDSGIHAWLRPVAHRLVWYRPVEAAVVYSAGGIVGTAYAPAAIPAPHDLVGQPAVLALVPEN